MSYASSGVYSRASYSGGPTFGAIFLAGISITPPTGSNLIAPAAVGRYGAWSWSNSVVKTASKAFPVRFGKNVGFVSTVDIFRPIALGSGTAVGPGLPAYGN